MNTRDIAGNSEEEEDEKINPRDIAGKLEEEAEAKK